MERPDVVASIENARKHPEQLLRRELRPASDVEWENPD